MLRIRKEHLEAITSRYDDDFIAHIIARLHASSEHLLIRQRIENDEDLQALVRAGIAKCRKYRIDTENDIERYILLMLHLDPHFDEDPKFAWSYPLLHWPGVDGEARLDAIEEHLIFNLYGDDAYGRS